MKKLFAIISLLFIQTAEAQYTAKINPFIKQSLTFTENKGQVTDQYGKPRRDIQFKTGGGGLSVFIGNGQLHYQWSKCENPKTGKGKINPKLTLGGRKGSIAQPDTTPFHYTMYRLDMSLDGANLQAQVIAEDKQPYYENYHTAALHTYSAGVCTYKKITYKNIYPNIDWTLYIKDNKLEYDFIVNPGGNVNDIKIKYSGATDIAHTSGNIKVTTPFGELSEQNLYAYEQKSKKAITSKFSLNHSTLSFKVGDYKGTLVIDPTLAWGTYYGGAAGLEMCQGDACDNSGNIFICGWTASPANIATVGAYQTTYNGADDAFLAKFSSSGSLLWATYYGGTGQDQANGVVCDSNGNAYLAGYTYSVSNIATTGSYQTTLGGMFNGFLAKFSNLGNLLWATYYGGTKGAGCNSVASDMIGDIYVCGGTGSKNGIATIGSYQDTLSGYSNAFLAKFKSSGAINWATYFGLNTGSSGAVSCKCDRENNIYITGIAYDTGIITTPGCFQDSIGGGGQDCFIAKFDSSCSLLWSTYFGGDSIDNAYSISCDDSLNVYITGFTNSTIGIASPGAHQTVYGGGEIDAFLAKFNDTGAIQWATYYGGYNFDQGAGLACDKQGNIYLVGTTGSPNNIATPRSYLDTPAGGSDAFLAIFGSSGSLLWATYFGGSLDDNGLCITTDGIGNEYLAGYTYSTNGIATPGCYQNNYASGFLSKFDTSTTGINNIIQTIKSVYLFPSPNNGNFIISGEFSSAFSSANIDILDFAGQLIFHDKAALQNGILNKKISIPFIDKGEYIMKISTFNDSKTIIFTVE